MKNFKLLLLAILVVCTACVLTVMAGATEESTTPTEGYVMQYSTYDAANPENNVVNDGTANNLYWTVADNVLTITNKPIGDAKNSTNLVLKPAGSWDDASLKAAIPWHPYFKTITKVVIEAPVTSICGYAFDKLEKCTTFVLPDYKVVETIKLDGSMTFANMQSLTTLGRPGTPEGVIDLRYFTGSSSQCFENSCKGKEITVLLPYYYNVPISTAKIFANDAVVTFRVMPGSAGETFADKCMANSVSEDYRNGKNATPYSTDISKEYYADVETNISGNFHGQYSDFTWVLDLETKTVTVTKIGYQFESGNHSWQDFKKGWNDYIEHIIIPNFDKIYLSNGTAKYEPGFMNMTALKTVKFVSNSRVQQAGTSVGGLFEGCTNLTAVAFGKDPVEGVVDFSNVRLVSGDSPEYFLIKAIKNCENVKKLVLPSTSSVATTLYASTIEGCTSLEEIVIGDKITTIEAGTFDPWVNETEGYAKLKVTFPLDSTTAESNGLASAGNLEIYAPKTEIVASGWVDQSENGDNDLWWEYDSGTKTLTLSGTATSVIWKDGATSGWNGEKNTTDVSMIPWMADYQTEIEKIIIEAPITTTPAAMFYNNTALKSVTFPAETVSLGGMAFCKCTALTEIKTAGVDSPANVIDLRNFTGTVNDQVFESAPANGATLWLPREGNFNLNNVFGTSGKAYHFVVYPGSVGEISVYNMINSRSARVYGTFDYTYYTEEQAPAWYAEYMATTSYAQGTIGTTTYAVTYDFNIATGKAVINCNNWDRTLGTDEWKTMITTWKYAIKTIHAKDNGKKITANGGGLGDFVELPELTAVIADFNRVQGALKVNNNKKLEAFGSSSNITKGVLNLSGVTEIDNSGKAIYANMFANNPLFKKLVLPKAGILTIKANAFAGCTGLTSIEIPAGCAITTVEAGAFAGLENPVVIYNYADNTVAAEALLASGVLPEGSYIYEEAASSGEGLTSSVVFDGWKVRTSIKNGLRGVFFADSAKIEANEENGWTLQEYGALLSASSKKNALGAKVYYDAAANTVTADSHLRTFPIYSTNENVVLAKKLKGADVENAANTYFAVSVVNYKANYTTEVYMAGYEVWTKDGETVILYTDYATDAAHDANLKDASIYEVSMRMYMEGFINDKNDPDDIVWNTLVAGGAVTLKKDTHYVVTDTKLGEGVEMKDLDGNAFGNTFALVKIPQVTCQVSSGVLTGFTNSGTALSIFNSPYTSGKYVLVHSSIGGTTSASTAASWGNGTAGQLQSNWFSGSKVTSVSAAKFPNPIIKAKVWDNIERVVFDTGITTLGAMPYRDCSATTYVYSEDFTKFASQSFESTPAVKTIYRAGYPVAEGTVDLHWLTSIYGQYTFDGTNKVVEYWLPADAKPSTQFFKANKSLTTVWFGGGYDENGKPENRVEGVIDFTNATALKSLGSEMFSYCTSTIKTIRLSDAITSISANIFSNGTVTGVTFQQPTYNETIAAFCQTNGFTYQNLVDGVWTTVEPVELEESEGWSGIIVK